MHGQNHIKFVFLKLVVLWGMT